MDKKIDTTQIWADKINAETKSLKTQWMTQISTLFIATASLIASILSISERGPETDTKMGPDQEVKNGITLQIKPTAIPGQYVWTVSPIQKPMNSRVSLFESQMKQADTLLLTRKQEKVDSTLNRLEN